MIIQSVVIASKRANKLALVTELWEGPRDGRNKTCSVTRPLPAYLVSALSLMATHSSRLPLPAWPVE